MADAARGASAGRVTAVMSHYAYARSDKKDAPRISIGGRLVADLLVTAGGGIFGHPQGVSAGVMALREAWEAAQAGVDLQTWAATRPALKSALGFW